MLINPICVAHKTSKGLSTSAPSMQRCDTLHVDVVIEGY